MAKKKIPIQTQITALESPTAAFPIGTLGGMPGREQGPPAVMGLETAPMPLPILDDFDDDDEETEYIDVEDPWSEPEAGMHPAFLALSLFGGAMLAVAVIALVGVFLLLG